jgi:hypothetical protein
MLRGANLSSLWPSFIPLPIGISLSLDPVVLVPDEAIAEYGPRGWLLVVCFSQSLSSP